MYLMKGQKVVVVMVTEYWQSAQTKKVTRKRKGRKEQRKEGTKEERVGRREINTSFRHSNGTVILCLKEKSASRGRERVLKS